MLELTELDGRQLSVRVQANRIDTFLDSERGRDTITCPSLVAPYRAVLLDQQHLLDLYDISDLEATQ